MTRKIEKMLDIAADMEKLCPPGDGLTKLIRETEDDELNFDQLDMVTAAAKKPDYEQFKKLLEKRNRG